MQDQVTTSGTNLRKFAERVFDCAWKLAIKQAIKQVEGGEPLSSGEYVVLRAKALAGFKFV
jgi:hypothetical protein